MLERFRNYRQKHSQFLKVVTCLNAAYLVSSLGDRLWSFSMGIIMHRLGGMTWVAIHQLAEALCKLLLATRVGDILDRVNRSKGIQSVLAANNICITISAFCFYLVFAGIGSAEGQGSKYLLITAILFGASSRVASEAQKTAFTKDWIVVLIEKSKGARLSTQNGVMNMIDQCAAFLTPFIAGTLLDSYSGQFCCVVIIAWNILSWTLEAVVFLWIYSKTPELSQQREQAEAEEQAVSPFRKYFRQKAFRSMFGLALLYMTVLGFDNLAISYGASQGMSASQLGFFRSMGSLLGFAGNGFYAIIERFIGVLLTALIGLTLQNIFINFCSVSVFLPGNPFNATGYMANLDAQTWLSTIRTSIFGDSSNSTMHVQPTTLPFGELPPSIIVFFVGITAARLGLWMADPAITQIMQETIPESERYSVNAAQNVFCEAFSIIKDILVILFPSTETFGALIILSCVFVLAGYGFYMSYFISNYTCHKTIAKEEEMKEFHSPEQEKLMGNGLVDHALNSA